jgi:hypothetical protein
MPAKLPTPTRKDARQAFYAVAGAADLAVSAIRHLPQEAERFRARLPGEATKTYDQLVRRGESLVTGIGRSRSTRHATEATHSAVSRVKAANTRARTSAKATRTAVRAARTSVRRAAEADVKAVGEAISEVGEK